MQTFVFAQNSSQKDSVLIQKEIAAKQRLDEIIKYGKEQCSKDSLRAINDSKTINKYYISITVPHGSDFPAQKELEQALKKLGIIWGGTWSGNCFGTYSSNSCYYSYMNLLTRKKFGDEFMNNLIKKSLLESIKKKPSIIFEYNEHLDWIYENNDLIANEIINTYFFSNFTYPKGYKNSSQTNQSFTEVWLSFNDETHKLTFESFEHHINMDHNRQFIPYFERKIKNFINSSIFVLSENSGRYDGVKTRFKIYYK